MKLEVGKWYMSRSGAVFELEEELDDYYPFKAVGFPGLSWTFDGFSYKTKTKYSNDLIKEVRVTIEDVEPASEFQYLKELFRQCGCAIFKAISDERRHQFSLKIADEIERLQKLFEGDGNA